MFIATLAIIIKDVAKADQKGIRQEFESKFQQIVSREQSNNFISRLYKGDILICPVSHKPRIKLFIYLFICIKPIYLFLSGPFSMRRNFTRAYNVNLIAFQFRMWSLI